MEIKEDDKNIPINIEAPPVPFSSQQQNINNFNIINNFGNNANKNINNISINKSNVIQFPISLNNRRQIKAGQQAQINSNIDNYNRNSNSDNPFTKINPLLLNNPVYKEQYLMYLNYIKRQQKNNINNNYNFNNNYNNNNNIDNNILNIPNNINNNINKNLNILNNINNINNPININEQNNIKNNSDYYDLILNINLDILKMLDKQNLIDILLFIQDNCKIKLDPKSVLFQHSLFKIYKKLGNNNEYLFSIQNEKKKLFMNNQLNINSIENNNINENSSDSSSDDEEEKDNIINEEKNFISNKENKIEVKNNSDNRDNIIFCELHKKAYLKSEYEEHLKSHNKCEKCGAEFETKEDLKDHMKIPHIMRNINCHNKQQEKNNSENNNINEGINDSKVKCTECNLIFDSVESMSAHYYEIHEKERIINNNKKLEELKKQEEEKRKEEIEKNKEKQQVKFLEKFDKEIKQREKENNNNEYYYQCYHDGYTFETEKDYVNHFYRYHKDDYPFYCDICNKGFFSYKSISIHNRNYGH